MAKHQVTRSLPCPGDPQTAKTHASSQMLERVLATSYTVPLEMLSPGLRPSTWQTQLKGERVCFALQFKDIGYHGREGGVSRDADLLKLGLVCKNVKSSEVGDNFLKLTRSSSQSSLLNVRPLSLGAYACRSGCCSSIFVWGDV